ncbi:ethylbenzene dehydrogenase-related protein [Ramlibacter sp.]|uniref:ethylbenzene dehydrogenase-related protein n=1 Tax=Ramlibacter sp. TaxID=1917967 RepID=UPI002BDCF957|nr:ethylbenzene dehydrogenase-related protein [Ramlibacter sp.]HWI83250.1 ethylbenzene dehydrogenase-related protein [Ramlibacter sp.]
MSLKLHGTISAVALATLTLAGCQGVTQQAVAPNTLVAAKAAAAPDLNAFAADPVWAGARALTVELNDGANLGGTGKTTANIKAVYTADSLYMLVQYKDPTNSVRRIPYQKQADGSWKQITDPNDKGGDNNLTYEDKWAMIWPINNSIKGFEEQGCAVVCHTGQGKPYGNKYTNAPGEIGDMWHMKSMRTIPMGHIDDQYVDDSRYDAKTNPNAGRKSDPGTAGGEYTAVKLVNGKPEFMNRDGKPANAGGTYYIKRADAVPFVDNFKPGDEVAAHISNPLQGDRADIKAVNKWENGVVTTVLTRKLVTGSKFDVQFNPANRYPFGFAVFDNAAVRHATPDDALFMVFAK